MEGNFYMTELAIQVLVFELGGRRLGCWRSNADADSYKKYVSVEWRAVHAHRTKWYSKGGPSSSLCEPPPGDLGRVTSRSDHCDGQGGHGKTPPVFRSGAGH